MSRFRPTRAGIVNLWDYQVQEFEFRSGWLVLRGPNGSGKTKALEVLFPFVLDGRLDPRRLDPFSGRERTMRDNLLYRGDEASWGYAWLVMEREGDDPATVTIGVGMRAQKSTSRVDTWFFVTDRGPPGDHWHVLDDDGRPRSRRDLADVLGAQAVNERAEDHRRAVDDALFGLGSERYEGMLDLVLTLRRPQLAKDLDPDALEDILRAGLRPLESELIEKAARAFDDLEAAQKEVQQIRDAETRVSQAAEQHRRYLRTVAAVRSRGARQAETEAEGGRVRLAQAQRAEAAAGEALSDARAALSVIISVNDDLEADLRACKESEAYRAAGTLEDKRRLVAERRDSFESAQQELDRATADRDEAREQHARRQAKVDETKASTVRAVAEAAEAASDAGIAPLGGTDLERAQPAIEARLLQRRDELKRTRAALAEWTRAAEARARAAEARASAEDALAEAARRQVVAAEQTALRRQELALQLQDWWHTREPGLLEAADLDALQAAAEAEDPGGLDSVLRTRLREREVEAHRAETALDRQLEALGQDIAARRAERDRVAAEQDDAPPPPPLRDADRSGRPGAPLWRLVRFRDGIPDADRAALEAALEAAGILDAWVHPDGERSSELDTFLERGRPVPSPTLNDVLEPETEFEDGPPMPGDRLCAILSSIALGRLDGVAVDVSGRFVLGPLSGAAAAPAARYIGTSARAARRRARVAELDARIAELQEQYTLLEAELATLRTRLAAWEAAVGDLPAVKPVRDALVAEARAAAVTTERAELARKAAAALDAAIQAEHQKQRALANTAATCRLPTGSDALDVVAAAVERFDHAARQLVGALKDGAAARDAEQTAAGALRRAEVEVEGRTAALREAEGRHAAMQRELATLEETLGAAAQEILARIELVEEQLHSNADQRSDAEAAVREADGHQRAAEKATVRAEEALARLDEHRTAALHSLAALADGDLAEAIGTEPAVARAAGAALQRGEAAGELLALAAALDTATADVSPTDDRIKAAQTQVDNAYRSLLSEVSSDVGRIERADVGNVVRLSVHDASGVLPLHAFAARLTRRVEQQTELLSAKERALLEDTLLASLAAQIQDRTHTARGLVREMDAQMRRRQLSSGQTVGIRWSADEDLSAADRDALALLAQDPALIGADGLATLRAHFAQRIAERRAERPDEMYREILSHVLDYRRWHRLRLLLVEANGSQATLTGKRHAQLSGGEKAATLHLPLFAAARARFSGGRPDCPHMLALDEAFAGIDDAGRPELLGLAAEFDLDLFMTGYDLWAAGPQVPAAAHYELMHLREAHEVVALRVDWQASNG